MVGTARVQPPVPDQPNPRLMDQSVALRFWSKVDAVDAKSCWQWTAAINSRGYGVLGYGGKLTTAHRLSLWLSQGFDPEMVCHKCDNKRCVNPAHLYPGSRKSNTEDSVQRGLLPKGEANTQAKLTDEKVREIRSRHLAGVSTNKLGKQYGVSHTTVQRIVRGEAWKHVK